VFFRQQKWSPGGKLIGWKLLGRDAYNGCLIWSKPLDYYNPNPGLRRPAAGTCRWKAAGRRGHSQRRNAVHRAARGDPCRQAGLRPADRPPFPCWTAPWWSAIRIGRWEPRTWLTLPRKELLWKRSGIRTVAGDGGVYVASADALSGFELKTGQEKWQLPLRGLPQSGAQPPPASPPRPWPSWYTTPTAAYPVQSDERPHPGVCRFGQGTVKCLWYYNYTASSGWWRCRTRRSFGW